MGLGKQCTPEVSGRDFQHQKISEEYDLVIVGGGISGLSAAYFFKKSIPIVKF
jgi:ribulose 1,5-bisphosphate synthetase/thiazole synthase